MGFQVLEVLVLNFGSFTSNRRITENGKRALNLFLIDMESGGLDAGV